MFDKNQFSIPINFLEDVNVPRLKLSTNYIKATPKYKINISHKFVPYYVGKSDDIDKRIHEHHNIRQGKALNYARMYMNRYNSFFKNIPIKKSKSNTVINSYISSNPGTYDYFNDMKTLKLIYPHPNIISKTIISESNHNPISCITLNHNPLNDSLKEIIVDRNNFWFCFAIPSNLTQSDLNLKSTNNEKFMKSLEAQTYYSLKGKTVSETLPYPTGGFGHTITAEQRCIDIFERNSGVIPPNPSGNFLGY
jgi:hypothetical protein